MKSRWEQYKEKNGVTIIDAFNPSSIKAEEYVSENRLNICLSCPELIKMTKQCKKCGCFMEAKTKLKNARCPLGNW
jgi:hypothetical protein